MSSTYTVVGAYLVCEGVVYMRPMGQEFGRYRTFGGDRFGELLTMVAPPGVEWVRDARHRRDLSDKRNLLQEISDNVLSIAAELKRTPGKIPDDVSAGVSSWAPSRPRVSRPRGADGRFVAAPPIG